MGPSDPELFAPILAGEGHHIHPQQSWPSPLEEAAGSRGGGLFGGLVRPANCTEFSALHTLLYLILTVALKWRYFGPNF